MKHTPGPWTAKKGYIQAISHATYFSIASVKSQKLTDEGNAANAKLIAAAPDMLAALLDLVPLIDIAFEYEGDVFGTRHNHAVDVVQIAVAVVNKATGVTP